MASRTVRDRMFSCLPCRPQFGPLFVVVIVYRRTKVVDYLVTARRMADYFLNNIPADGIIPWDFDAPIVPPRPADSSAAMIAANGLLLLAMQEQSVVPINQSAVSYYSNAAIQVPVSPSKRPFLYHTWSEHCL
jgi:hypothetical protein